MDNKENNQIEDIEVVIGDDSVLNISEVGDCMNDLRPKSSEQKSKNVIIPKAKKKKEKQDSKNTENSDISDSSEEEKNPDNE